MNDLKRSFWLCATLLIIVILSACGGSTGSKYGDERPGEGNPGGETQLPQVTIKMENGGEIVLELYPDVAPNTVNNFIDLVEQGFYDGLIFHRVIPGFMIQGGDPQGIGIGGPGYSITGEFASNGVNNTLSHERGVISMARTQHPDSAGSQFFIMHRDTPQLDGDYAAFGKVISGMEIVDEIAEVDRDVHDKPLIDQIMAEVTVETFGIRYPKPEKITP